MGKSSFFRCTYSKHGFSFDQEICVYVCYCFPLSFPYPLYQGNDCVSQLGCQIQKPRTILLTRSLIKFANIRFSCLVFPLQKEFFLKINKPNHFISISFKISTSLFTLAYHRNQITLAYQQNQIKAMFIMTRQDSI